MKQESSLSGNPPPYPASKPSGVDWLGDVPAHWKARRLRKIGNPDSVKMGYGVCFTRHFAQPRRLRAPDESRADMRALGREFEDLLGKIRTGARPHTAKITG